MDKEHQKREKKEYARSPIFIYMTSCREFKGREIIIERDYEINIRSMKIGGAYEVREILFEEGILIGGVTLFPMMLKEEKEKYKKRKIRSMNIGGETPRGDTLFH
jgi:hypothetical protein